jgi:hypothetical protein
MGQIRLVFSSSNRSLLGIATPSTPLKASSRNSCSSLVAKVALLAKHRPDLAASVERIIDRLLEDDA